MFSEDEADCWKRQIWETEVYGGPIQDVTNFLLRKYTFLCSVPVEFVFCKHTWILLNE